MPEAISNTSPLLYLHRIGALNWLPRLFHEIWIPNAVVLELREGLKRGYDVPDPQQYSWLQIVDPRSMPPEWLSLDMGAGERATMALALENPDRIVLLDDALARRVARAAGLRVWGTLKILLEAKAHGLTRTVEPLVRQLKNAGMWLSEDIVQRVLALADEQNVPILPPA